MRKLKLYPNATGAQGGNFNVGERRQLAMRSAPHHPAGPRAHPPPRRDERYTKMNISRNASDATHMRGLTSRTCPRATMRMT